MSAIRSITKITCKIHSRVLTKKLKKKMELQKHNHHLEATKTQQVELKPIEKLMKLYDNTSLSVLEILNSKENSLVLIKKNEGEMFVIAFLIKMINRVLSDFNVSNSMNGVQITKTAKAILKLYWGYKISHFKLCFERAASGFYGTNYNRIDQEIVMGWLYQFSVEFDEETSEIRQMESQDQKAALKEVDNTFLLPVLKSVVEKFDSEKKPKATPLRQRTEAEKKANEWMKMFDVYYEKKPVDRGGIRFIKRYGKTIDITEFLEYKSNQFMGFKHIIHKFNMGK